MAVEIEQQINNVSKAIDTLTGKITRLQDQMSSGHLGSDQVRNLQRQIDTLNATLEKRQNKKTQLVNDQEIQRATKAIETLKAKAAGVIQVMDNQTFNNADYQKLEKELARYESAIKSFYTRIENLKTKNEGIRVSQKYGLGSGQAETNTGHTVSDDRLGAVGARAGAATGGDKLALERTINKSLFGSALTNAELKAVTKQGLSAFEENIASVRAQIATHQAAQRPRVAGGDVNQAGYGQPPLEPADPTANLSPISMLTDRQVKAAESANRRFVQALDKEVVALEESAEKEQARAKAKQARDDVKAEAQRVRAEDREAKAKIKSADAAERQRARAEKADASQKEREDRQRRASDRSAAADERRAKADQERARVAEERAQQEEDLRNKIRNDPAYMNFRQQLEARGLSVDDVKSATNRGGGITQVNAGRMQGGINNKFQAYVNESTGRSTPGLSSQFRTFGSDILRDIGQFTKWSIAIAAVYTPLKKLSELMTIMVDNESRLADAAIAANIPFEKAGTIFDASAEAANRAGESITGVIDAYAQAIRAAGRYNTEQEKVQKGTQLLADSLILSKLSALDQATAIDTLSAALLQSDRELDGGQELLNKWVKVSQIANVTIDGLATGVAVLGDAAETSGLSIDELNGLIAVLSEQSISGAKEAANVAKALIGAYQGDKAEQVLNRYGIALRKANGEVRGFLEIYQELAKLRQEGILSEAAVSEVALALGGGGVRRAKDASALINSTDRLNAIAKESAAITGEDSLANDALAKKLQTVETANTRLANSFQELAQTLGDDGGLLDSFKSMINLLTAVVSGTNELFAVLGRSGPLLATFVTGLVAIQSLSAGTKATALARLGVQAGSVFGGKNQFGAGAGYGKGLAGDILQMNYRGAGVIGGAGVALQAGTNLAAGRDANALANVAGGAIGAAIGGYLGGPPGLAIGANIGSATADGFVTGLTTHSQDLAQFFAGIIQPPKPPEDGETTPTEVPTAELIKQAFTEIGGGQEWLGTVRAFIARGNANNAARAQGAQARDGGFVGGYGSNEAAAIDLLKKINPQLYAQLKSRYEYQSRDESGLPATATPAEKKANVAQIERLQIMAERERENQLKKVATGDITTAQYGKTSQALTGFPTFAKKSVDAFGDALIATSKDINTTQDAYKAFLDLTVGGTAEQTDQINKYSDDLAKLRGEYENWNPATKELPIELTTGTKNYTKAGILEEMKKIEQEAATFTTATIADTRLKNLQLPSVAGSLTQPSPAKDVDMIYQEGLKYQERFLKDQKLTADEIVQFKDNIEAFSVFVERAGQDHFETMKELDQKYYDAAQKYLEDQGKIKKDQGGIGFQQFDLPYSQLQTLAGQSLNIGESWKQKFNYDFKPEDQIAIANDGIVQPLHADFKILALLLEKIVDQNQKQLDGQYNIPEGATFWVPLTAAYYRNKDNGGENGLQSLLDSLAVDTNTTATEENTVALRNATDKWSNIDPQLATRIRGGLNQNQDRYDKMNGVKEPITKFAPGGLANPMPRYVTNKDDRYDQMNTTQSVAGQSLIDQLKNFFGQFYQGIQKYNQSQGLGVPVGGAGSVGGKPAQTTAPIAPTQKLDLKFSSSVNLLVDGRMLAQTLQNYFASELLRTEQTTGVVTKRYVI